MNQKVSMLREAYQFINDKNIFHCVGGQENRLRLKEMLKVLLQTQIGRSVVVDVGRLMRECQVGQPVTLMMQKVDEKMWGWTNAYLEIAINKINLKNMTPRQQRKTLLMQSITLIHELVHVCQFLKGKEICIQKFSAPHQIYANILEELEASMVDRSFEVEIGKLYPHVCKDMHLCKGQPGWRKRFAESFWEKVPNKQVPVWIDLLVESMDDNPKMILSDKMEQQCFKQWVNSYFKKLNLPFSYQRYPVERVFWAQKKKNNALNIKGGDTSLLFDRQGRLVVLGTGFGKEKESALKFSVFVYKRCENESQKWADQIKEEHPKARIYVVKGGKEKKFSGAYLMKEMQRE